MTYRVEISRRAAKAVTGLDKPVRRKVLAAIGALAVIRGRPDVRS